MTKLIPTALFATVLAGSAFAGDDFKGPLNIPRAQWLPVSEVTQKLAAQGYKVIEIEADDGDYEFEATDAAGARIEGHAHPATGEVLSTHPDN